MAAQTIRQGPKSDAPEPQMAMAEIAVHERKGFGPDRPGGGDPDMGRRPRRRAGSRPRQGRPAGQTASSVDQAQSQKVGADLAPVRRTEAVDHQPVAVEQEGDRAVRWTVAGRRNMGAETAMMELAAEGGDDLSQARAGDVWAAHGRSHQAQAAQALCPLRADDDMVVDGDVEDPGGVDDPSGHVDVGP